MKIPMKIVIRFDAPAEPVRRRSMRAKIDVRRVPDAAAVATTRGSASELWRGRDAVPAARAVTPRGGEA